MVVAMTVLAGLATLGLIAYVLCGAREAWDLDAGAGRLARLRRRRERVLRHAARFREGATALGFGLLPSRTPIQPILAGTETAALAASEALLGAGVWVPAIRPPTVPRGRSRLRVTFSAAHDDADVDRLLDALATRVRPRFES